MPSTNRRTVKRKAPARTVKKKTSARKRKPTAKPKRTIKKKSRRTPPPREPAELPTPVATFYF